MLASKYARAATGGPSVSSVHRCSSNAQKLVSKTNASSDPPRFRSDQVGKAGAAIRCEMPDVRPIREQRRFDFRDAASAAANASLKNIEKAEER